VFMSAARNEDALCKEIGGHIFFPDHGDYVTARLAKSICSNCTIKLECLREALTDPNLDGIWGGTSRRDRARLLRAQAAS